MILIGIFLGPFGLFLELLLGLCILPIVLIAEGIYLLTRSQKVKNNKQETVKETAKHKRDELEARVRRERVTVELEQAPAVTTPASNAIDQSLADQHPMARGTDIDDYDVLLRTADVLLANPRKSRTSAIKQLGIRNPSLIRHLRDKYKKREAALLSEAAASKRRQPPHPPLPR
jgi:hypothetical protein